MTSTQNTVPTYLIWVNIRGGGLGVYSAVESYYFWAMYLFVTRRKFSNVRYIDSIIQGVSWQKCIFKIAGKGTKMN